MRAYLDHASTTPLRPPVLEAMLPWMSSADPGRVHTEGRMARAALEDARTQVADAFGTRSRQVIFTSGATEAIHAAVFGALSDGRGDHAVVSEVEHAAVRDATARAAAQVTWVGADPEGRIRPSDILAAIGPDTALVHCQWANQEVGTLQPVAEIVAACRERGITIHVDAASAAGRVPIDFDALGADLLSVSAHKLGGPPGVGGLLVRRGRRFTPLLIGGSQERARRAGMENVAGAVGFAAAVTELGETADSTAGHSAGHGPGGAAGWGEGPGPATTRLAREAVRATRQIAVLRDAAVAVDGVSAVGPADPGGAIAHLLCVDVAGVEAEGVLLGLDQAGVAAHSGSSCSSELLEPSPVLAAMGLPAERSLRLSVGWTTTDEEIALAARVLPQVIGHLRALAG